MTKAARGRQASSACAPRFVGREVESRRVAEALAGQPTVILVEGEAGVGKTRLVREVVTVAGTGVGKVLLAVCPPFREPFTLGPVVDALRQAADAVGGLRLSALAGALRPLFPEWADDLPPEPAPLHDATAARHRLFRALAELLGRLSVRLLVVEDAHWADEATLEFLLFLAARPPQSVSLVITSRPQDVPASSLLRRLSARPSAGVTIARVVLEPLDVAGTAGMISSMLDGEHISSQFAAFVHERTGGLPLAVEESVRLLCDSDQLIRHAGQWERRSLAELAVPPTVRDSVLDRVQRLGQSAQRIMQAAAVLADPASEPALATVAGLAPDRASAAVVQALGSGLLQESASGMAFRHVLACKAVHEAIPVPGRRRMHLRAARALERASLPPVAVLARHFREAGATDEWCRYAEQAADLALATGDDTTAATLLHDVVVNAALPADAVVRLTRKVPLYGLTRFTYLDDLADCLRSALDTDCLTTEQQADGRSRLGWILLNVGDYPAGVAELERAIPGLAHRPVEAARAMVRLGWADRTMWPAAVHRRWVNRAAEVMADASIPGGERLELTVNQATALLGLGEESGWAVVTEIPEEPRCPEETAHITRACMNIGSEALQWGLYADARRRLAAGLDLAERHEYPTLRAGILLNLARLAWVTGSWDGLAARVEMLAQPVEIHPRIALEARLIAGLLEVAAGIRGAGERLRLLHEEEQRQVYVDMPLESAAVLARLRLAEGQVEDALTLTGGPIRVISVKGIWLWATAVAPVRVQALVAAGRDEEATRLVASFARGLRGRDAPAPRAALATCRAILAGGQGEAARAVTLFARASAAWQALPQPYNALLAQEGRARCLLTAGEQERGLALMSQVFQGLSGLGAGGDADRVARTLRDHEVRVGPGRAGRPSYGEHLSPREVEVVRLLVARKTDREIADTLFLSPKTVANHLDSARRKLKVSSRIALVATVIESGLLADEAGPGTT